MKIVIVDDERYVRCLLEQTLEELEEEEGVEILSAADGETGWALIEKENPSLVFLDIMMPGMSGYEVSRAVQGRPDLADTRVVLLTAKGQETDREEGLASGAVEYVTKPFDPDRVLFLARKLLGLDG